MMATRLMCTHNTDRSMTQRCCTFTEKVAAVDAIVGRSSHDLEPCHCSTAIRSINVNISRVCLENDSVLIAAQYYTFRLPLNY